VPDDGYPEGTRFIVRREIPHPGAQLTLFDTIEGFRHQVMATDTPAGGRPIQYLEARRRASVGNWVTIHVRQRCRWVRAASTRFAEALRWASVRPPVNDCRTRNSIAGRPSTPVNCTACG